MNLPKYEDPFYQWALAAVAAANNLKEKQVTQTLNQTAEVQAFQADLIDRAVRWARDNDDVCEMFTTAMDELFPGVAAVDSDGLDCDGLDCEGNRPRFNGAVDVAKVKADVIKGIVDQAVRLARQYPHVVSKDNARLALSTMFPGVNQVDSDGKGL